MGKTFQVLKDFRFRCLAVIQVILNIRLVLLLLCGELCLDRPESV